LDIPDFHREEIFFPLSACYFLVMVKIVLIDYGVGNIGSLKRSFNKVGANVEISGDPGIIKAADGLVLPGVGSFGPAMDKLLPLAQLVVDETKDGKPLLGICLGMQLLFNKGLEGGEFNGLGLIHGIVRRFPEIGLKIPQIGWNSIQIKLPDHPLMIDIPQNSYVYFVHSYFADTQSVQNILTTTEYALTYPSAVCSSTIFATQFHPEKSGPIGLKILQNYINYVKGRH
jgi:glutamine amidotransferase